MSMMRPTGSSGSPRQGGHRGASQVGEHPELMENQALRAWPQARVQAGPPGPGLSGPSLKEKVELEV